MNNKHQRSTLVVGCAAFSAQALPIHLLAPFVLSIAKITITATNETSGATTVNIADSKHRRTGMTIELHNATLEWAADWIEGSLTGESNERVREFGRNMVMTLRAAKSADLAPVAQVLASSEDPHPGYDCAGTCVIHSGRFAVTSPPPAGLAPVAQPPEQDADVATLRNQVMDEWHRACHVNANTEPREQFNFERLAQVLFAVMDLLRAASLQPPSKHQDFQRPLDRGHQ